MNFIAYSQINKEILRYISDDVSDDDIMEWAVMCAAVIG